MTRSNAPLDRSIFDVLRPFLRLALGLMFIGFSAVSTVTLFADDLSKYAKVGENVTIYLIQDRYWYGLILAVVLSIGEFATSVHDKRVYAGFLLVDAFYTARGAFPITYNIFSAAFGNDITGLVAAVALSIVGCIIIGVVVAYWGEILVFGPRKVTKGKAQ